MFTTSTLNYPSGYRPFPVDKLLRTHYLSQCSGIAVNVVEPAGAPLVLADTVIA